MDILEAITFFLGNPWVALNILWEMNRIESVFDEFIQYSRNYFATQNYPVNLDVFREKINNLVITKEYCGNISITKIKFVISANIPWEALQSICDIPKELTSDMAEKMVRN